MRLKAESGIKAKGLLKERLYGREKVITVEIAELKIATDRLFRHLEEKA